MPNLFELSLQNVPAGVGVSDALPIGTVQDAAVQLSGGVWSGRLEASLDGANWQTAYGSYIGASGVAPGRAIFKNLVNRVGGGRDLAAANGTPGSPARFAYIATEPAIIQRLNVVKLDGGAPTISEFASAPALDNGLLIECIDDDDATVLFDFLDGAPIVKNGDWTRLAGVDLDFKSGSGLDGVTVRWTLARAFGAPFRLDLGQALEVKVQDDLTAVSEINMLIQGAQIGARPGDVIRLDDSWRFVRLRVDTYTSGTPDGKVFAYLGSP